MAASKQLFEDAVIPLLTGGGHVPRKILPEEQLSSSSLRNRSNSNRVLSGKRKMTRARVRGWSARHS